MLDDTPHGGNGEGGGKDKDCFQQLPKETQLAIGEAFEKQPMAEAANLMTHHGVCNVCVAYYSYVSMTLMLSNAGANLQMLAVTAGHAVGAVLHDRWSNGSRG